MLAGRFLFGSGSMSLLVLQDRITAIWFKDQELGLAFGLTLGVSRLGSVLNFLFTQSFEKEYGMQWTLWGGVLLCVIGLFVAMIVSTLDKIGMRQLGREGLIREESKKMSIQDLKLFPLRFWLLTLSTVFFYNIIFPFLANASEFFHEKYSGYSRKEGAYIAGTVYDLSLVLPAFFGVLVDNVGLRAVFFMVSSILTLFAFGLLAFTYVPPLVSTVILGVTYSCAGACTWPSIALVVPQATVGTAMGLVLSMQMAGNGVCNMIIGWILGTTSSQAKIPLWRWQWMVIFMVANTVCCLVSSVLLNVVDHRQGGTLNKTTNKSEHGEGEALRKIPSERC
ncbi:lysosomal dipeptide transporter MFSD1-like [Nelusetta ayraudi]|uniref:lysosomal dipeptide transporter MFSD1-like n=1 Tax=Nelusetta ayraudi TaxID=303726 RepID=UPI003F6E9CC6